MSWSMWCSILLWVKKAGEFDIADVCNHQSDKLMFRHDFIDWSSSTAQARSQCGMSPILTLQ